MISYELTDAQDERLQEYLDYARSAKRDEVIARANDELTAIEFLLTFALDEQIRRFEKQGIDKSKRTKSAAQAAIVDKLSSAKTNEEKLAIIAELMSLTKK
jgi:hypothetical protein